MIGSDKITPDEIVGQNLREMCVHDALSPLYKSHWFRYMHDLMRKCLIIIVDGNKKLVKISEECHDEVIKDEKTQLLLDMQKYKICYSE